MDFSYFRPGEGDIHPHRSVPAVPSGRCGPVLHKSQPALAIRDLDQGQAPTRALSDEGHRYHEQWLPALYTGQ